MTRIFALMTILVIAASCTPATPDEPLEQLGEFSLGHNVVVASKMRKGPVSRNATEEEWIAAMKMAVGERFGLYQGTQVYHLGISIEGYMLAPKGVPLVYSPKSALIINVTAWDDAAGRKLNDKPEQFTVLETTTSETFLVGSGHDRTKAEQLRGLSRNAVGQIDQWLLEQHQANGWFSKIQSTVVEETDTEVVVDPDDS